LLPQFIGEDRTIAVGGAARRRVVALRRAVDSARASRDRTETVDIDIDVVRDGNGIAEDEEGASPRRCRDVRSAVRDVAAAARSMVGTDCET